MNARYFAPTALLPEGWATDVTLAVEDGFFVHVAAGTTPAPGMERLAGPVIPGMANLHSHAFQRAMAGLTERAGPAGEDFWAWRECMYRFLSTLNPDQIEAIALALYVEMLEAGYTAVGEFHYLHCDPAGRPYGNLAETGERIVAAAARAGLPLTLLPVLYRYSQFGRASPTEGQRRFILDFDQFSRLCETLHGRVSAVAHGRLGIAPHSLRAVDLDDLARCQALAEHFKAAPLHIHVAEQRREVEDCRAFHGASPVRLLLDRFGLDARWCVVHATHLDAGETADLARCGAIAGLCPSTEGDLGDGHFPGVSYSAAGGRFGIGGDSHVAVNPFLELRLYETSQRLVHERRNLLAMAPGQSVGSALYAHAAASGAQALGQDGGALAPGRRADCVVLDLEEPALGTGDGATALDGAIFGPARQPVRDVMVAGGWCVREGRHPLRTVARRGLKATLLALGV